MSQNASAMLEVAKWYSENDRRQLKMLMLVYADSCDLVS